MFVLHEEGSGDFVSAGVSSGISAANLLLSGIGVIFHGLCTPDAVADPITDPSIGLKGELEMGQTLGRKLSSHSRVRTLNFTVCGGKQSHTIGDTSEADRISNLT